MIDCTGLRKKIVFLRNMIVGIDLLAVLALSIALTRLVNSAGPENAWLSFLSGSKAAMGTLGALYSFALVFRTNICYARWWEGRTLWGTIIVTSIRIAQQGRLWIEDQALVRRLDNLAIVFAYACKAQLRGNRIEDSEEDGAKLVHKGLLSQEELNFMGEQSTWQPYYCIDAMRATTDEGLSADTEHPHADWRKNASQQAMEDTMCTLASSIGGCIRVRSTGLPAAYDNILYSMGAIFFVATNMAWAPDAGPYTPVVSFILYVFVKMIVGVGNDMEDPFGDDESDLPLEDFCATVEGQVNAIAERSGVIRFNLAEGPQLSAAARRKSIMKTRPAGSYYKSFTFSTRTLGLTDSEHDFEDTTDSDIEFGQSSETDPLM